MIVTDIDGDGDKDILVAGKTGVHWLENLRVDKVPAKIREQQLWLNVNCYSPVLTGKASGWKNKGHVLLV